MSAGFSSVIWEDGDTSEQIVLSGDGYVLVQMATMKMIPLGQTVEEAVEKLKELEKWAAVQFLK
ncbi:MAG TPA: hypothetical protein VN611_11825 [Patescibacteria group bacterium]|nr:hypothetical protein [Patescibacteria group bacterium]